MKTTKNKPNPIVTAFVLFTMMLIFVISCNKLTAQEAIGFSVFQDVKLGLGKDNAHGNNKPTTDVILSLNLEGKQFEWYYFSIQAFYEYADLYGGKYHRYGVNGVWNFNHLVIPKLEVGAGVGIGMINRERQYGVGSYSGVLDISYPITKNLSIVQKNEWVKRSDLPNKKIGYNLLIGLKYKI